MATCNPPTNWQDATNCLCLDDPLQGRAVSPTYWLLSLPLVGATVIVPEQTCAVLTLEDGTKQELKAGKHTLHLGWGRYAVHYVDRRRRATHFSVSSESSDGWPVYLTALVTWEITDAKTALSSPSLEEEIRYEGRAAGQVAIERYTIKQHSGSLVQEDMRVPTDRLSEQMFYYMKNHSVVPGVEYLKTAIAQRRCDTTDLMQERELRNIRVESVQRAERGRLAVTEAELETQAEISRLEVRRQADELDMDRENNREQNVRQRETIHVQGEVLVQAAKSSRQYGIRDLLPGLSGRRRDVFYGQQQHNQMADVLSTGLESLGAAAAPAPRSRRNRPSSNGTGSGSSSEAIFQELRAISGWDGVLVEQHQTGDIGSFHFVIALAGQAYHLYFGVGYGEPELVRDGEYSPILLDWTGDHPLARNLDQLASVQERQAGGARHNGRQSNEQPDISRPRDRW